MSLSKEKLLGIFYETISNIKISCIKCENKSILRENKSYSMRCTWKPCRKTFSLLKGTPFFSTKIPLEITLKVIRMWCSKVQAKAIAELLELNKNTASRIINKMAKLIIPRLNSSVENLC
jgi:transposase-like protein